MHTIFEFEALESRCLLSVTVPTFSSATSPTGSAPVSVAVGDFNNDGKLDFITSNSKSGTVTVSFGKGTGAFGSQKQIGVGNTPMAVVVGDFNKDNNLDFAVALQGTNQVGVYLGSGAGTFTKAGVFSVGKLVSNHPATAYGTGAKLAVGDFDNDGKLDIASLNVGDNTVSILRGQGTGQFLTKVTTAVPALPGNPIDLNGIAAADFNGDGKTDLVVSGYNVVSVMLSTGSGSLNIVQQFKDGGDGQLSDAHDVIAADLTGDGILDLAVVAGDEDAVTIFKGLGGGQFSLYTIAGVGTYPFGDRGPVALTAGDFNNDGHLDLAIANPTAGTRTILTNDGTGKFPAGLASETPFYDTNANPPTTVAGSDRGFDIAIGDFNKDGKLDLVTANGYVASATVLLNTTPLTQAPQPVIDTFTIDPTTFPVNSAVTFTVNASETNGTIANVAVYLDTDGTPGLNPATDFKLSSNNGPSMVLHYGTGDFTPATYTAYALATDTTGQTAQKSIVITVTPAQVVNNFSVTPSTFPVGQQITLTANGTGTSMSFYIDTDGTNGINPSTDYFLGTVTSSNSLFTLTVDTSTYTPGTYAVHALSTDSAGHTGDQMVTITALKAPVITRFDTPIDVYVDQMVDLQASAFEKGGTITSVKFYRESNGTGQLEIGGDTLLGTGTLVNGFWKLSVPATSGYGDLYAVATDANGVNSAPAYGYVTVDNYEPVVYGFTATPSSAVSGSTVVLSTKALGDLYDTNDAGITNVKFYRESNGNNQLNVDSDTSIGSGTHSNGVWSISTSTAGLPAGTYTYYAIETDVHGVNNASASTTVTLTAAAPGSPVINSFSIAPSTFTVGTPMQLTANVTETNGTIANVKFYIDVDGTPGLNPATDFFLGTATSNTSTFTLTAATGSYTPGTYTVYAYATDGTGKTTQKSAVITATAATQPSAGTLLAWEVGGQSGGGTQGLTATTVAAGDANSLGLTKGSGLKSATASKAWGASGWAATSAAGITGNKFVTFGLTVGSGYKTSLTSVDFHYRRTSDGPANVLLQYQLNSGAWVTISDVTNAFPDTTSSGANASLNVSGVASLQNISAGTSVNFRLTPYGATASTGTWYIYNQTGNDLVIKGSSTATP